MQHQIAQLSSVLHQRDSEVVALTQERDGAIEQSKIRAKDLAKHISSLKQRIKHRDDEAELFKMQVSFLSSILLCANNKQGSTCSALSLCFVFLRNCLKFNCFNCCNVAEIFLAVIISKRNVCSQIEEQEKWKVELQKKGELCNNLKSSCK